MGNNKRQGPTLGARFTEPGVRFIRVSIRKERSRLYWLGSLKEVIPRGAYSFRNKKGSSVVYILLYLNISRMQLVRGL